jgi:aldehyde:ferredoxin oxidoreductase
MTTATGGLTGKILRVDLTRLQVDSEPTPTAIFQQAIGARGVGAHLLYQEVAPHTDPLGPENKLIFLTGPLEGTLAPGSNKITVTFRSPLTGTYSFSLCGGHLGPELKFAGYDGLIIEGRAGSPVYLWIDNGRAVLRDAAHLWGKLTHDTEDAIRKELKDKFVRIATIGPAGEKLVRFACIQSEYGREFGRGGAGAVMGAKNLKAIALRGSGSLPVADPAALERIAEQIYGELKAHPKANARRQYGTPEMVAGTNNLGYWAANNFQTGYFEEASRLTGTALKQNLYQGDTSCYACPVACGKVSPVYEGPFAGTAIEGAEFETIGLLGPNCGISDPNVITAATAICDTYGIDTMSAGGTVSFAMEAFERGAIGLKETGGLELRFGSGPALLGILEQIVERRGLGNLLAEGSRRAAEALGVPELAMHVKGQELATYEPRGVVGMGLSYAISPKGGHHMIAPTMGLEVAGDPARRLRTEGKAQMVRDTQLIMAVVDSLSLCSSMRFVLGPQSMLDLYAAVTGQQLNLEQAYLIGERITNLERMFNLREGYDRAFDNLPKRLVEELMPDGPSAGNRVDLDTMLDEYYTIMGWDDRGRPTVATLERLGLLELTPA